MTASRGFGFSVGGWIKLDIDQLCVCERHQAGTPYLATGYETARAGGWKMHALALCGTSRLCKRLLQS